MLLIIVTVLMCSSVGVFAYDNGGYTTDTLTVGPMYVVCPYWDGQHRMQAGTVTYSWVYTGNNTTSNIYDSNGYVIGYKVYAIDKRVKTTNYYCACGYSYNTSVNTGETQLRYLYPVYY